jgi:endonuclease/exonuclease/phosphatase family metal-dependent hydrolase
MYQSLRNSRRLRIALSCGLLVIAVVIGTYVLGRLRSATAAVSVEQIAVANGALGASLRIGSYNIAHGRGGKPRAGRWEGGTKSERMARLGAIADVLKQLNLDVVVLNEIDFRALWSYNIDQAAVIAQAAHFPFIVRQRNVDVAIPGVSLRFGNAILSRFPIAKASLFKLPTHSTLKSVLLGHKDSVIAHLELSDNSELAVWAFHLNGESKAARLEAAELIAATVREYPLPLILAGDFNSQLSEGSVDGTGSASTAMDRLLGTGFFEHFPAANPERPPTFSTTRPRKTIDWILVSRGWQIESGKVVKSRLSDHFPVAVTITAEPTEEQAVHALKIRG